MTVRQWIYENGFDDSIVEIINNGKSVFLGSKKQLSDSYLNMTADNFIIKTDRIVCDITQR